VTAVIARYLSLVAALFLVVASASAQELEDYREFRLGSSLAVVSSLTAARASDLHVIHERPALLQDLAWRPRFAAGAPIPNLDPVDEIVFSFYNDQLFKIAVRYDNARTAGMTREDITSVLSNDYGTPTSVATVGAGRSTGREYDTYDMPALVAKWQRGETTVTLSQATYGSTYTVMIVALPVETLARTAKAAAVVLDAREAPAREAARAKKQDEDSRAEKERARTTNKGSFRP
jgi:hypothetical protein